MMKMVKGRGERLAGIPSLVVVSCTFVSVAWPANG